MYRFGRESNQAQEGRRATRGRRFLAISLAVATTIPLVAPFDVGQAAAPVGQGFEVNASDLRFILKQIKIAEQHVANTTGATGPCGALMGPGENQIPEGGVGVTLPWGLRTVDGSCNNIALPSQSEFGTADNTFPRIAPAEYRPGYTPTGPNVPPIQDSSPRMISNLIVDQSLTNPAAVEAAGGDEAAIAGADGDGNLFIPNVAPDTGLSAPYNSWFTIFGQFFDHGLDLVNKGGAGLVQINLPPGDPLLPETNATPAFDSAMFLSRATHTNGEANNQTSSWVDQSQTYASHPSHQVFLREYVLGVDGKPVATGRLIEGVNGGMATWARVKQQAREVLGIELVDTNVTNVPLLATDPYGNFFPGANGFPQIVLNDNTLLEGVLPADALSPAQSLAGAAKTGHAFLDDIAHHAAPKALAPDADTLADPAAGSPNPLSPYEDDGDRLTYDDEMLGAHFIAGDGRLNENIALTAVHHVFHSEHNRLAEEIDEKIDLNIDGMTAADEAAWRAVGPGTFDYAERLFQAARFVTEMEYQHLAFEEFARKVQPMVNLFGEGGTGYHTDIDPRITAEFAHAVYRFGHSMLTETVDRTTASGAEDPIPLLDAFLNPPAYFDNTTDPAAAAGEIVMGMTRQVGNELDEFVTEALRNDLVGLPLDLAALNIARGRETGVPSLNSFRRTVFAITGDSGLAPYSSWIDFSYSMRYGEASLKNFVAAYGAHPTITAQTTAAGKRNAANALFTLAAATDPIAPINPGAAPPAPTATEPTAPVPPAVDAPQEELDAYALALDAYNTALAEYNAIQAAYQAALAAHTAAVATYNSDLANNAQFLVNRQDAIDFLDSTGPIWSSTAAGVTTTGVDSIDLWMGGLAERQQVFGGLLGSTFNYVFEKQMENLQDGDRFYYLSRTAGLNLLTQLEGNSFAELTMRNTSAQGLPADSFARPAFVFDLGAQNAAGPIVDDPATDYAENGAGMLVREPNGTIRYTGVEHVVFNGTPGQDKARASEGDDTFRGNEGNDVYEGGDGNDSIVGGGGDDILTDLFGDDVIKGGPGNDTISSGRGFAGDLNQGGSGSDFIIGGNDMTESFAGAGNDFVYAGDAEDTVFGDEGDDWIEGGKGPFALLQGDSGAPFQDDPNEPGHDVIFGWGGEQDYDAEGGDDIMFAGPGIQRAEGMLGFDWVTHRGDPVPGNSDMSFTGLVPPAVATNRDKFDLVEALSGWQYADVLRGDNGNDGTMVGHELNAEGIARIANLSDLVGTDGFTGGNIILGGAGSDLIEGRGGNDVIDGDRWLDAQLRAPNVATTDPDDTKVVDNLPALRADVLAGRINPGQIVIERAIKTATDGAVDTALFTGLMEEYDWVGDLDAGVITVTHVGGLANEGTDRLRNIERLQFLDGVILGGQVLNHPATGTVTITGNAVENQTLTATPNVADVEGVNAASLVIEWQINVSGGVGPADWQSIGVQGTTLLLTDAQVGFPVRAVATFLDNFDVNEQVESLGTLPVVNVNDAPTGAATISTLDPLATVAMSVDTTTIADEDGLGTFTIEWFANGVLLPVGTGASFTPGIALAGRTLQVVVSWIDGHGTPESISSETTLGVTVPPLPNLTLDSTTIDFGFRAIGSTAPVGAVTVTNTGTALSVLNVSAATVSGIGAAAFTPDNGCAAVPLAPLESCTIGITLSTAGPVGTRAATLTISSNDLGGDALVALTAIMSDNVAPTGVLVVDDVTPIEAQTLNASPTLISDANGLTAPGFTFRWQQNGLGGGGAFTDIAGANSAQLIIGQDQVNRRLRAVTTFTDDHGTVEQSTSAATGLVGDVFVGGVGVDTFTGTVVTDIASGGGGNDTLNGNAGNDTLTGGADNDTVNGDGGNDLIQVGVGDGFDAVNGGAGTDTIAATGANTQIGLRSIAGIEQITSALFGGVTISGTTGVENLNFGGVTLTGIVSINGGGGNDVISGSAAADDIRGGSGNDTLNGNGGIDTIRGGGGTDTITPGAGNDVVVFAIGDGTNRVNGFDANPTGGQDRLDVQALGISAASFAAAVVRTQVGGDTRIQIGSVVIILTGITVGTISATDFILLP